jgi:DNA-binding NtrC family response regulator
MDLLRSYSWPGNIRELENAIEQAVALSYQPILAAEDLPRDVRERESSRFSLPGADDGQFLFADTPSLEEVKKRYVLQVLKQTQGNVSATARILNVDRRSLYRMLARYKVEPFLKDE